MLRSPLTRKLILSFLLVAVISSVLVAVVARWMVADEFNRLVNEQTQTEFVNAVTQFYRLNHAWDGVRGYASQRTRERPNPDGSVAVPRPSYIFMLADKNGMIIIPASTYKIGDVLPATLIASGIPIVVEGQTVGMAIATGSTPTLEAREERYLSAMYRVLLSGTLIAAVVAVLVGVLLSYSLTRTLRELSGAIRNMTPKTLGQPITLRSRDEFGELATAFNQLSADLAQSNHLRQQLTADVAHELRTPLQIIAGYIESIQDGVLEATPERLAVIYSEVEHLQHLVTDLRTLTFADSHTLTLNWQEFSADVFLRRISNAHLDQAQRNGVTLNVVCPDPTFMIKADEDRLMQVFKNIVTNALRYTSAGGSIVLAASRKDNQTILSIQDTGQGIDAVDLPFIFERFYRADKSRSGNEGESGLGLAIARVIIQAHGGTITAVSPGTGHGTTFTITLSI